MADRGGKSMTVDRLKRDLLNKLINARIDLAAYLQLRKAKGYMSVSESEHLRDNLFELCNFMREKAPALQANYGESEEVALRRAAVIAPARLNESRRADTMTMIDTPNIAPPTRASAPPAMKAGAPGTRSSGR